MQWVKWNKTYLDLIIKLWNEVLGESFPMRKILFNQNSFQDENVCYEASRIAINDRDEVVGFIVAKKWQEKLDVNMPAKTGWIQVLLVHHAYRNRGIGTKLLTHAEEFLKQAGIKQILLGKDSWHYFPGIPKQYKKVSHWFEKKGYESFGTEYDMINNYSDEEEIKLPHAKNAEFTILDKKDKDYFLDFLKRCFPGRWEYEAIKYFEKGGTGREFVVLRKKGEIIGFCRINDSQSPLIAQNVYWAPLFQDELGGIGPLGVDADERGNGYGLGIVVAAITYLRNRGISRIVIDWTGLVEFYGKLGYKPWKSYLSYRKYLVK